MKKLNIPTPYIVCGYICALFTAPAILNTSTPTSILFGVIGSCVSSAMCAYFLHQHNEAEAKQEQDKMLIAEIRKNNDKAVEIINTLLSSNNAQRSTQHTTTTYHSRNRRKLFNRRKGNL